MSVQSLGWASGLGERWAARHAEPELVLDWRGRPAVKVTQRLREQAHTLPLVARRSLRSSLTPCPLAALPPPCSNFVRGRIETEFDVTEFVEGAKDALYTGGRAHVDASAAAAAARRSSSRGGAAAAEQQRRHATSLPASLA